MVEFRFSSGELATSFPHLATTSRALQTSNYIVSITPTKNTLRRLSRDLQQYTRSR
jgi:hypothetical protein